MIPLISYEHLQTLPDVLLIEGIIKSENESFVDYGKFEKRIGNCPHMPTKYICDITTFPSDPRTLEEGFAVILNHKPTEHGPLHIVKGVGQLRMTELYSDTRLSYDDNLCNKLPTFLLGKELPNFSNITGDKYTSKVRSVWYERTEINTEPMNCIRLPQAIQIADDKGNLHQATDIRLYCNIHNAYGIDFHVAANTNLFTFRKPYKVKASYDTFEIQDLYCTNISVGNDGFRNFNQGTNSSIYGFVDSRLLR